MSRHISRCIAFMAASVLAAPLALAQEVPEEERIGEEPDPDIYEDADRDGVPDYRDTDDDNDGVADVDEVDPVQAVPVQPHHHQVVVNDDDEDDEEAPGRTRIFTRYGLSAHLGGGVGGFIDEGMRDLSGTAGLWEARLTFGTRTPVALEAAYVGSLQGMDALGLDDEARLLGTSVEGAVRINILARGIVQPYLVAGLGWTRFDLTNYDVNQSSVEDQDDVMTVPLGIGASIRYMNLVWDLRGTIKPAFYEDLVPADDDEDFEFDNLDSWNVAARVGFEF